MSDYIVRATAADAQIRAFAATTKEMTEFARAAHDQSPVVTAALGRLLTAGAMMGTMLKNDTDMLTMQIRGDGPVKGLTVTADAAGHAKGYAMEPQAMRPINAIGKLDVGGVIGAGYLSIIKDMGLKEPYVGQVSLQTGEIAEDLTYYFAVSEQIPSSVGLGVLMEKNNTVKQAGGFIIQLMPFAQDSVIDMLENNLKDLPSVTSMLDSGMTPEDILRRVLTGMEVEIVDTIPTGPYCNCSKERVEKAIISIGRKDIQSMIDDNEPIEVKCQFCNKAYGFSVDDMKRMLKQA